jgi:hypothetical protein
LNGSFLTNLEREVTRQQRHDDGLEERDGILAEIGIECLAQEVEVALIGEDRIQHHQRTSPPADNAFRAAGGIARLTGLELNGFSLIRTGINRRFHEPIIARKNVCQPM